MTQTHDTMPEIALDWHLAGRGAVLATVVETWGSAPRQAGSQLVISGAGEIMGSVSGGCVEGAVMIEATEALTDGVPRLLTFGVSDDSAFAVGLACGGTIRVLVDPVGAGLPAQMLADLVALRAARAPCALRVNFETWAHELVAPTQDLLERFRMDRSGVDGAWFTAIHNPPLRLIVVGAVHIAQPLLAMARLCGFDCTLVDPRAAFATAARFPDTTILDDWPDDALHSLGLDARTAVVTLTHDAKLDDPAIVTALSANVFYIGSLGSTRTHAKRLERLSMAGLPDEDLARIHAPVGLNIGAKTPAEIAISILAQITQTLRKP